MKGWLIMSVALAACLAFPGCKNKLSGTLTLNDKPFALESCRSGQVYGFHGVELKGSNGDRLRLVQAPGGDGLVYYFKAGQPTGHPLGKCGPLSVTRQNSTINKVSNVEGSATLKCNAGGIKVSGNVSFKNCH